MFLDDILHRSSGRIRASILRYQTTGTSPLSASSVHLLLIFGSTGSMVTFPRFCFEFSRLMGRAGTRMVWLRDFTREEDFYIGGRLARLSGPPRDKYCKRTRFSIAAAANETPPQSQSYSFPCSSALFGIKICHTVLRGLPGRGFVPICQTVVLKGEYIKSTRSAMSWVEP